MFITLVIIAILICILLSLIILVQNPKDGSLSAGFAGSNNVMGVKRTGDFLEKGTWGLVISLMVVVLLISVTTPSGSSANSTEELQKQITTPTVTAPITPQVLPDADTTKN